MSISQTTINYAKARGLELESSGSVLEVYSEGNDAEYMFSLRAQDGQFFWGRNVSLPQLVKEELPAYYPDEKALRLMLAFVSKEIAV
jgi:hypothetical protein